LDLPTLDPKQLTGALYLATAVMVPIMCQGQRGVILTGKIRELTCWAFVRENGAPRVPPLRYASVGMTNLRFALPRNAVADEVGGICVSMKSLWPRLCESEEFVSSKIR
jgi:hypothetical protein